MKHILKHPSLNAIGLILFSGFYAAVFMVSARASGFADRLQDAEMLDGSTPLWQAWSRLLADGNHVWIAWAMIALSAIVLVILAMRRHPYDEYHTVLLINSLAVATIVTLLAIAVFFLLVLINPAGIVEKFMLFAVIHWVTVVLANLVYLLVCRTR